MEYFITKAYSANGTSDLASDSSAMEELKTLGSSLTK